MIWKVLTSQKCPFDSEMYITVPTMSGSELASLLDPANCCGIYFHEQQTACKQANENKSEAACDPGPEPRLVVNKGSAPRRGSL